MIHKDHKGGKMPMKGGKSEPMKGGMEMHKSPKSSGAKKPAKKK